MQLLLLQESTNYRGGGIDGTAIHAQCMFQSTAVAVLIGQTLAEQLNAAGKRVTGAA